MDPGSQIVLLIIAASLFFAILLHLRRRGRRGVLTVALLSTNLVIAVVAMRSDGPAGGLFFVACGLFAWLVILPAALAGVARQFLRREQWGRAALLLRVRALLQPTMGLARDARILDQLELASEGRVDEAVEQAGKDLQDTTDDALRLGLVDQIMRLFLYARRYPDAVALFEAEGGLSLAVASIGVCASAVRAYAEVGQLETSAHLLDILEQMPAAAAPQAAATVNGARMAFVAHLGLEDELQQIFDHATRFLPTLSPVHHALWMGLAHARAGDVERAEALWRPVAEQQEDRIAAEVALRRLAQDLHTRVDPPQALRQLARQAATRAAAYHAVPRSDGAFWRLAPVTAALLVVLVAIHLAVEIFGDIENPWTLLRLGANFRVAVLGGELWRLSTSTFLHGNLLHICLNGYALYLLGRLVEQMFGSLRFFTLYTFAGLAGSLASALYGGVHHLSVGASGAIFGLVGAALVGLRQLRGQVPEAWRQQLTYNLLIIIGLQLYIGFTVAVIDNAAHVGGLIGGALAAVALRPKTHRGSNVRRRAVQALAAMLAALTLGSAAAAAMSSPAQMLRRIPLWRHEGQGVRVRCPAHWVDMSQQGKLALRDPLTGILQPPTLEVFPPVPLGAGDTLTGFAAAYGEQMREQWERLADVKRVRVKRHPLRRGADVARVDVELNVGADRFVNINLFRQLGGQTIVARLNVPAAQRAFYEPLVAPIAESLGLAR